MARRPRWLVFADDTGDPGETGTPYFGYALLAVEHKDLSHLIETRARFRVSQSFFAESKKGRVGSAGFDQVISDVSRSVVAGRYRVAAVLIAKDRYSGPWLRPGFDQRGQALPADPTFLRNYLVRKALALLFDGYDESATVELVLDRVAVSDEQIINLRDYLKGHFALAEKDIREIETSAGKVATKGERIVELQFEDEKGEDGGEIEPTGPPRLMAD